MTKILGFGTELAVDYAGGTSYTPVAQVHEFTLPGVARDSVDVTTHDSADMWREFIKGLKDGGEFGMTLTFDPVLGSHDAATGVLSDFDEDVVIPTWRLTFPDTGSTQWTFPGFCLTAQPVAPINDRLALQTNWKVSGKPTLA